MGNDPLFAQISGLVISALSILAVQMKKKWQILAVSFAANALNILLYYLINGRLSSMVAVSVTACLQCAVNIPLAYRGKLASAAQKTVFAVLYFAVGVMQYETLLDVLPIAGSMLFMAGSFQKTEQRMRLFSTANAAVFIAYNGILGSTAVIGQIFSLLSDLVALFRYREKKE